jgi:hypothetical protein
MLFQEVGEEKHLEHCKDNKQFYQNNRPKRLAKAHIPETVVIEVKDPVKVSVSIHKGDVK